MLCKKCNTENLLKADYCQACGNKFTPEEKNLAYEKTIFGKFEKLEKYVSYLSPVKFITGNKLFKRGVLVAIILYSIFMANAGNNHLKIEQSNSYEVLYNKTENAYYLVSETDYVNAQLFVPKKAYGLTVYTVDDDGVIFYSQSYGLDDAITLEIDNESHYIIEAEFKDESQSIEVYVVAE